MKLEAFTEALVVVNEYFKRKYGIASLEERKPYERGPHILSRLEIEEKATLCYDKLILCCDGIDVLNAYKEALDMGKETKKADSIVDLREAIRKELGFGISNIDSDVAWRLELVK